MAPAQTSPQAAVPAPVGRPRLGPRQRMGLSAREEILDAAAQLFSEQGYAGTSTRAIALAVGIKQASLYYHFANKEQMLVELLNTTVVPSLGAVEHRCPVRAAGATVRQLRGVPRPARHPACRLPGARVRGRRARLLRR